MTKVRMLFRVIIDIPSEGTLEDIYTEANKRIDTMRKLCDEVDVLDIAAYDAELSFK